MNGEIKLEVIFAEATYSRVIKIWWSFFWRFVACYLLAAAIGGFVFWFTTSFTVERSYVNSLDIASKIFSIAIVILLGIVMTKNVLNKKFSDFRIILVRK